MGSARLIAPALHACLLAACASGSAEPELARAEAALRPDDPGATDLLFRFGDDDVVESHDGAKGRVRVHYTRSGPNGVRADAAEDGGIPDDVLSTADIYERLLERYDALGYRAPLSDESSDGGASGSVHLDIYLLDFGGRADGSFVRETCLLDAPSRCSGYVVQENDFAGYRYDSFASGTRTLASHELFHAVQAAYDADQGANFGEATAVWASEHVDPELTDFEAQIAGWLQSPERSIDQEPVGPVDPYSYGLALFFQYLDERFGAELIRRVLEGCEDGAHGVENPRWLDVLVKELKDTHATDFHDAWLEYASWALYSGLAGTQGTAFANSASYPRVRRVEAALPFQSDKVRMFPASLRAWSFAPEGRTEVVVQLAPSEEDFGDLTLFVGARRGGALTLARGGANDPLHIDAEGADELVVAIANASEGGASRRPILWVGTEDELLLDQGDASTPPSGVSDAGAPVATPSARAEGGCSVAMPTRSPLSPSALLLGLVALLGLRSRGSRQAL